MSHIGNSYDVVHVLTVVILRSNWKGMKKVTILKNTMILYEETLQSSLFQKLPMTLQKQKQSSVMKLRMNWETLLILMKVKMNSTIPMTVHLTRIC